MMINAPDHPLAAASFLPADPAPHHVGLVEWALKKVQVAACGLHGHDPVLQYERTRMFLRCTSCGHESPGWDVPPSALCVRRRGEPRAVRSGAALGVVRRVA
jgi:hypothetical protein